MGTVPQPVDYSHLVTCSMNLAGRFTGREIRGFGQNVLKNILMEKQVGIFFGQQISFKPCLPDGFKYVGTNRAFLCYDEEVLKASDERQYRHFLRDLHLRGHLPHHYLPDNNYVVMKMRYRQKPWTEFIAMSWVTDENQTKLKDLGCLRKVMNYVMHLAEAEEMPVLLGGTFRMPLDAIKMEMDGDFRCYGYIPSTPRRKMRMSDIFLCSKPMKIHAAKPLVCGKMGFELNQSSRWVNPEDAFYWDPIIAEIMFPIQTPETVEEARRIEHRVHKQLKRQLEVHISNSQSRPITGISSKHLLVSAPRASGMQLPTAPVLPTPQENSVPPPSPSSVDEPDSCKLLVAKNSSSEDIPGLLPAIDEVSSEYERQDSVSVYSDTITGEDLPQGDQDREEKIFELLEAMMNDKSSTFFVQGAGVDPEKQELDPLMLNLLQVDNNQQLPSIDELKATIRARLEAGTCPPQLIPENISRLLSQEQDSPPNNTGPSESTESNPALVQVTESPIEHTELEMTMLAKHGRIPSYQELYDEELIENNMQCYMS